MEGILNRDSNGGVTEPLIENECRDQLLERLAIASRISNRRGIA